jgi:hypothetical protein
MSAEQIQAYFRRMGYNAKLNKNSILIGYNDEDVLKDEIVPMIVNPMPACIASIVQIWHQDEDSFDMVKLILK